MISAERCLYFPSDKVERMTGIELRIPKEAAQKYFSTPESIEQTLLSKGWELRYATLTNLAITLSPAQIQRAFNQSELEMGEWQVCVAAICRPEFMPTPADLKKGLKHRSKVIRSAFASREAEWRATFEAHQLKKQFAVSLTKRRVHTL
jgi:hypothetical protein